MHKTTLYLPEDLEHDIDAAARALGVSKAEFMRRSLERSVADAKQKRPRRDPYLVLPTGRRRARSMEEIDDAIYESVKRRASKR
ncbi:hypothetical protein GCM10009830_17660 [Glycomyces endophyticus]|uniref:Ribbon-helix-helix protein CopG domain-containing protein n=1 Tax=Glycomyces endophyticus TaxID=480996 RepID=A0ABP4SFQ6_9ACTN